MGYSIAGEPSSGILGINSLGNNVVADPYALTTGGPTAVAYQPTTICTTGPSLAATQAQYGYQNQLTNALTLASGLFNANSFASINRPPLLAFMLKMKAEDIALADTNPYAFCCAFLGATNALRLAMDTSEALVGSKFLEALRGAPKSLSVDVKLRADPVIHATFIDAALTLPGWRTVYVQSQTNGQSAIDGGPSNDQSITWAFQKIFWGLVTNCLAEKENVYANTALEDIYG